MRSIVNGRTMLIGVALLATAGMSACSANHTPDSAEPGSSQTTAPAAIATTTPAASPAITQASGAALAPMQTAAGGEFFSPSDNISCEVYYNFAGMTHAYCQTSAPAESVTMDVTGKYTTCTGEQCLGNAGMNAPTLAYGEATGVGPFRCQSAAMGITCTAGGKGFLISSSGITPV